MAFCGEAFSVKIAVTDVSWFFEKFVKFTITWCEGVVTPVKIWFFELLLLLPLRILPPTAFSFARLPLLWVLSTLPFLLTPLTKLSYFAFFYLAVWRLALAAVLFGVPYPFLYARFLLSWDLPVALEQSETASGAF